MLHPDSHNMFENGSFLRRRRRFKQESGNNSHHRNQQGSARSTKGTRNSPNTISPVNQTDPRPNGTKTSRSRTQLEKDSPSDELELPRKVHIQFNHHHHHRSFSVLRNMPVIIPQRKSNQLKPVNQVIIHPPTLVHHLHQCAYQVLISSIPWLQQESTILQLVQPNRIFLIIPMLNIFIHLQMIITHPYRIIIGHIQLHRIFQEQHDSIWSIRPHHQYQIRVHYQQNRIYRIIQPMAPMLKCRKWWEIIHPIMNSILNTMPNTVKFRFFFF